MEEQDLCEQRIVVCCSSLMKPLHMAVVAVIVVLDVAVVAAVEHTAVVSSIDVATEENGSTEMMEIGSRVEMIVVQLSNNSFGSVSSPHVSECFVKVLVLVVVVVDVSPTRDDNYGDHRYYGHHYHEPCQS